MADSSGFGVGAVVVVVQAGASVGKMMGMDGVGRGVDGVAVEQEAKVIMRIMKNRKWKVEEHFIMFTV